MWGSLQSNPTQAIKRKNEKKGEDDYGTVHV